MSETETMVERVARAICLDLGEDPDALDVLIKDREGRRPRWEGYESTARAVIAVKCDDTAAPRDSDETMVARVARALHGKALERFSQRELEFYYEDARAAIEAIRADLWDIWLKARREYPHDHDGADFEEFKVRAFEAFDAALKE